MHLAPECEFCLIPSLGRARSGPPGQFPTVDSHGRDVPTLAFGLHVIEICLHVLHVNVVTYVIFFYIQANLHVN